MIKLKSLLTEGKVNPKELAELVRKAITLVLDIDNDLAIVGGMRANMEWFDSTSREWSQDDKNYYHKGSYKDGALSTRFIYSIDFRYRVHWYRTHHEFLYYRYPINSLDKMSPEERLKTSSYFQQIDYKRNGRYFVDDRIDTSDQRWPDKNIITGRSPQTIYAAEILEKENSPYEKLNKYYLETPLPKQLKDLTWHHWNDIDWIGVAKGRTILELAKNIKRIIDGRGGSDDEEVPEPDPTPVGRKPTLVPA